MKNTRKTRKHLFFAWHNPADDASVPRTERAGMSTTILLVRHGETAWNREKIFRGTYDIPLNDNGRAQAQLAAEALGGREIHATYTSPLSRASETAAIVLAQHSIEAITDERLTDFNYGDWNGKQDEDVAREWPEEHAAWCARPETVRAPGGDTLQEVFDKAFGAMEELAARHDGQTVALFAHRVVNKLLVLRALGLGLDRFPFIIQGNCCVNEFEKTEQGYLVQRLNDTSHMKSPNVDLLSVDF
jgi:broad specificity phosphatase PhoE